MDDGQHENDDEDGGNTSCISQKELEKLVLMPNSVHKMIFDGALNLVFLGNILVTSSIIAFNMYTFEAFFMFEFVVDWIVLSDLILTFFTAYSEK